MTRHPLLLAVLTADLMGFLLLLAAAATAFRIALHWNPAETDRRQLRLQARSETAALAVSGAFGLHLFASVVLIYGLTNILPGVVPGAMCGTGVLQAMQSGGARMLIYRCGATAVFWVTHEKTPAWVEVRNLAGEKPDRLHVEMEATASQSPRTGKPVYHLVLSPAPEDQLDRKDWHRIADQVLGELGLEEHQAVLALHTDTGLPHLHLAINRVHPETLRAWNRWQDRPRIETALRRVEREWGLRRVPGRSTGTERQGEQERAPLSTGQAAQLRYRATEPQVVRWRRELAPHFEAARSWSDLAVRLEANGIRFQARGRGMVVTDGEVYAKASSIGREYSRGKLEARFGQGLAEWTKSRERFDAAAGLYARYAHREPGHPRSRAALRALRSAGSALGWKAAARLSGPLAPVVGAVVAAAVRQRMSGASPEAAWEGVLRLRVAPALEKSRSWAEVEGRLRWHGMWIERARSEGSDLVVTDGVRSHSIQRLGEAVGEERLRGRLGSWETWQEQRRDVLAHARRLQRFEATVDERQERWHRMIAAAQRVELRVERYREARGRLSRDGGAAEEAHRASWAQDDVVCRARAAARGARDGAGGSTAGSPRAEEGALPEATGADPGRCAGDAPGLSADRPAPGAGGAGCPESATAAPAPTTARGIAQSVARARSDPGEVAPGGAEAREGGGCVARGPGGAGVGGGGAVAAGGAAAARETAGDRAWGAGAVMVLRSNHLAPGLTETFSSAHLTGTMGLELTGAACGGVRLQLGPTLELPQGLRAPLAPPAPGPAQTRFTYYRALAGRRAVTSKRSAPNGVITGPVTSPRLAEKIASSNP